MRRALLLLLATAAHAFLEPLRPARLVTSGLREFHAPHGHVHVVMISDSLMRYQFVNLIYYLEYGVWPGTLDAFDPSWEQTFESWPQFYWMTTHFVEHQACDCARGGDGLDHNENRWYRNPALDMRASYIQWFGGHGVPHGHLYNPHYPLKCIPGECHEPFDWQLDVKSTLSILVPPLHPTHVIINVGFWPFPLYDDVAFWQSLCDVTVPMMQNGVSFFWATTTIPNDGQPEKGSTIPEVLANCSWQVFDRFKITAGVVAGRENPQDFYMDEKHFNASVYTALNKELIKMLWPQGGPFQGRPMPNRKPPTYKELNERYEAFLHRQQ